MRSDDLFRTICLDLIAAQPGTAGSEYQRLAVEKMMPVLKHHLCIMTQDIEEFHEKFKLDYKDGPRPLDRELHNFRQAFMQEELDEYETAHEAGDLEGQLDALVDLIYVALGTAYMQGFPFAEAWRRVHEANMAKVRAERAKDSKRGSTFDVVKPDGWTAPDHSDLVEEDLFG